MARCYERTIAVPLSDIVLCKSTLSRHGFGDLWTQTPRYQLVASAQRLAVEVEYRLGAGTELILGFSSNTLGWGGRSVSIPDALTVRVSRRDCMQAGDRASQSRYRQLWVRTGVYNSFLHAARELDYELPMPAATTASAVASASAATPSPPSALIEHANEAAHRCQQAEQWEWIRVEGRDGIVCLCCRWRRDATGNTTPQACWQRNVDSCMQAEYTSVSRLGA